METSIANAEDMLQLLSKLEDLYNTSKNIKNFDNPHSQEKAIEFRAEVLRSIKKLKKLIEMENNAH